MKSYGNRARERFEQIKANYMINDPITEFNLEEGLRLQEEYKDIPIRETKRRNEVLKMANYLLRTLPKNMFKSKKEELDVKYDGRKLLIFCNDSNHLKDVFNYFDSFIPNSYKKYRETFNNSGFIKTINGIEIKFLTKAKNAKGVKCDYYLNLTGDLKFEREILMPMIKK